jgi:serine/threonine protein kinase
VEAFPQEADLIQKMLQLNPLDRPSTTEILRHPLLSYFVVPPRCSTPVLRRSNSRLAIPSPLARSRSGRLGFQTPDRSLDAVPPEPTKSRLSQQNLIAAYQENMGKSRRSLNLRPTEPPPPLTLTTSAHSSFTFDKEDTARSFTSSGTCVCSEDVEKLQTTINTQKDTLDKMVTRMQSYEEQLKSKESEIQSLKSSLQQLHLLFEKMQNQMSGGQK